MGTSYNTNVVSDGLMGCWDAANKRSYPGTGTTWTDIVGGNNATLINMEGEADSGFESQKMGVMAFDGTDAYANIGDVDALTDPTTATASVWFRREGETASYGGILAAQFRWGFIYFNSGDELKSYTWLCTAMDGYTVTAGWHQAVTTWTASGGSNSASFYVDGILISQGQICYSTGSASELEIGRSDTLSPSQYFEGDITAIYIHDRVLSAAEVKQNYEATKSRFLPRITTDGLFASWDAGDPASYPGGTTLKDTANHYDGTFVNNGSGGDVSFDSANGGSLVFDGSDDYVNIITLPDCSSLARSAIIWVAVDDWPTSDVPQTPFQSAADQFDISFGVTLSAIYFNGGGSTASTAQKYVTLSPVPADGAWICWAMTIDSSGDIVAMYRNGVALTASGTSAGFSIKNKTTIGCRINTDNTTIQNPLDGKVGSLRLYTKTLSAAEVMDNFQKTRGRFGV